MLQLLPLVLLPLASALNITYYTSITSLPDLFPSPLPAPFASADPDALVAAFNNLGRTTDWKLISATPMQGNTYEPEGMVHIGDNRIVVSAGEYIQTTQAFGTNPDGSAIIINGTDRTPGIGFAHFIVFDTNGTRLADATLTAQGAMEYHNGGIDYDGQNIFGTIAQYRPNSTAYVYETSPCVLTPSPIAHIQDHQGGVVYDTKTKTLYTLNWGSRSKSPPCHSGTLGALTSQIPRPLASTETLLTLLSPSPFVFRGTHRTTLITKIVRWWAGPRDSVTGARCYAPESPPLELETRATTSAVSLL